MIADPAQPVYAMRDDRDMDRESERERRGRDRRERDRDMDDTAVMYGQPPRQPQSSWLDPRLLIQVVTIIITVTAGWVTLGNRLDGLQEKLVSIQGQLPNREVLELRLKAMEEKSISNRNEMELEIMKLRKWQEDATRELIRKGVM